MLRKSTRRRRKPLRKSGSRSKWRKSIDLKHFEAACRNMTILAGDTEIQGGFIFGAVTNSTSVAGMKNLTSSDMQFDDGLLESQFVRRPNSLLELEQLKKGMVTCNLSAPCLVHLQAERFQISSPQMTWILVFPITMTSA